MRVDNDEFANEVSKALRKSEQEKLNSEKIEFIKKDLESKEGRQFFICLEKHANENPPPSIINAALKVARDEKIIQIIKETIKNLNSSFLKSNDFSLFQCSEAFKKEYQGLEIIHVYNNTLNEKENSKLKQAISAAELKYSKHGQDISKLKTFLSMYPSNADGRGLYPPITADLGILRWLIITVDNIDFDITKILLTLPKEIMKVIFDEMFDQKDDVVYKTIIEKEYYYFSNNTWGFLNTVFNYYTYGDVNLMSSLTVLSLALKRLSFNPQSLEILDLLLDHSNKKNRNMNFAFSRNPTNNRSQILPQGDRNYFHDLIEGICYTTAYCNSETPRLACQAIDTLIKHGFTDFNLNYDNRDSPFACLVDAFAKKRISEDTFRFITNHLIRVCNVNINYKIRSSAIKTPNAGDSATDELYDNFFRCRSPLHIAITGGHYLPYGSTSYGGSSPHWYPVRTENLLRESAGVAYEFLLHDMQRALLGEFEAMVDEVLPTVVLPPDSDQNNHLRARWCRTLQEYTWSNTTLSKVDPFADNLQNELFSSFNVNQLNIVIDPSNIPTVPGDSELSAEDLKLLNVANAFSNTDPDKRSISDFENLWENGNTENQSSEKKAEAVSSKDANLNTNVQDIPNANTSTSVGTKETADKNQFALIPWTPNPILSLNAANPNHNNAAPSKQNFAVMPYPRSSAQNTKNRSVIYCNPSDLKESSEFDLRLDPDLNGNMEALCRLGQDMLSNILQSLPPKTLTEDEENYIRQLIQHPRNRHQAPLLSIRRELKPQDFEQGTQITENPQQNGGVVIRYEPQPHSPIIAFNAPAVNRGSVVTVNFKVSDHLISDDDSDEDGIANMSLGDSAKVDGDYAPSGIHILKSYTEIKPNLPAKVDFYSKHQEFHEKLTHQLTGFYLHCPVSQNIRESTVAGYYFNMYPNFPLAEVTQNIVAEYLAIMIPSQQRQMNPSVTGMIDNSIKNVNPRPMLLAFNRGRDLAKMMVASPDINDKQMEETLLTLTKSDIFDQVSECQRVKRLEFKKQLDAQIAELKAQLEPFQIWADKKNQNDTKLQKMHKDYCEQVLRHFLDKFGKENIVAFREIFAAIPKSPFHTEFEWLSIGISKIAGIQYIPLLKLKFISSIKKYFNKTIVEPLQTEMGEKANSMIQELLSKIPPWEWTRGVTIKLGKDTEAYFMGSFIKKLNGMHKIPPLYSSGIQIVKCTSDGGCTIIHCRLLYTSTIQDHASVPSPWQSMNGSRAVYLTKYYVEFENTLASKPAVSIANSRKPASANDSVNDKVYAKGTANDKEAYEKYFNTCLNFLNNYENLLGLVVELNHTGIQKIYRNEAKGKDIWATRPSQYGNHLQMNANYFLTAQPGNGIAASRAQRGSIANIYGGYLDALA